MAAKINNVTNTDIEMLIESGRDLASRALDISHRIYSGRCEELDQPIRKGLGLLATARALTDLATRILRVGIEEVGQSEKESNYYEKTGD